MSKSYGRRRVFPRRAFALSLVKRFGHEQAVPLCRENHWKGVMGRVNAEIRY